MAAVDDFVRELQLEATAGVGEVENPELVELFNFILQAPTVEVAMQRAIGGGIPEPTVRRVATRLEEGEEAIAAVDQVEEAQTEIVEAEAREEAVIEQVAENLPPGYTPAEAGERDAFDRQIVAYDELGQPWVVTPDGRLEVSIPAGASQEDELPPFLGGLPEDYAVIDGDQITTFERGLPSDPATIDAVWDAINTPRPPRYREGDQLDFAEFSVERRAAVSEALVAAGFLDQDIYDVYGASWTSDHARAMAEAMTEANIAGKTWSSLVQRRAQQIEDAGGLPGTGEKRGRVFVMPARREPDFASLAQDVKAVMRSRLERDPLDWELSLLADEMQDAYRSQYDAEVQAARQEFDAGNHATAQAEGGQDVFTSAGTVQEVDPIARFRESFEERYADEIELTEDRAAGLDNISNVFSKLTSVTRMMGG